MNTRENTLKTIRLQDPAFVPVFDGTVWEAVALGGNFEFDSFTDQWGVVWRTELKGLVPVDVGHPLPDLTQIDKYAWPDPATLTWTAENQRQMDAIDRRQKLVGGLQINFIFERLRSLMGTENFLVSFYEEPDRLQVAIDRIVDYQLVCLRRLLDLGVEIIHIPEDLGSTHGPLISPELFRRFIMPAYERCFAEVLRRGVMIDFHTDGAIEPLLPDLMSLGIHVLNPVEVRANNQPRIRAAVQGKLAVLGGLDSKVVHTGTVADVQREVRRAFAIWKPGGGWLAAPDQVVTGAPPDNIRALWDTCWELAAY